jgi:hypothetical protein
LQHHSALKERLFEIPHPAIACFVTELRNAKVKIRPDLVFQTMNQRSNVVAFPGVAPANDSKNALVDLTDIRR